MDYYNKFEDSSLLTQKLLELQRCYSGPKKFIPINDLYDNRNLLPAVARNAEIYPKIRMRMQTSSRIPHIL